MRKDSKPEEHRLSKEELMKIYAIEMSKDESEFVEHVRQYPSPKEVLKESICGVAIDLSDYESFQVSKVSPFDFETLTAYNTAFIYKEAMSYLPQKIKNYQWLIYLIMMAVAIPVGIVILKQVI